MLGWKEWDFLKRPPTNENITHNVKKLKIVIKCLRARNLGICMFPKYICFSQNVNLFMFYFQDHFTKKKRITIRRLKFEVELY